MNLHELMNDPKLDYCIKLYMHCRQCMEQKPEDISAQNWSKVECGWTKEGFQVWCLRHNCNVFHMDFEGAKHPARVDRKPTPEEMREQLKVVQIEKQSPKPVQEAEPSEAEMQQEFERSFSDLEKRLMYAVARHSPLIAEAVLPMIVAHTIHSIADSLGDAEGTLKTFVSNVEKLMSEFE